MDKTQYMLDNFKRAFPTRAARLEREWEAKQVQSAESVPTTPKIDWNKPLICNNNVVTSVKYLHTVRIYDGVESKMYHVCKLTYKQGYTYFALYNDDGRTAGNNAGTINVKNKVESWGRSAWMILDVNGMHLSSRHASKYDAMKFAQAHYGTTAANKFQYIRYDYTESR